MASRPNTLPWDFSTFSGNEPVTTLSDNFTSLNNVINDSGAGWTSYARDTGTTNNLVVTLPSAPVAYEVGMMFCTVPAFSNTGGSVVNVNSLGNVPIVNAKGGALSGGELPLNFAVTFVYNGTSFVIVGNQYQPISSSFTASTNQALACDGASSVSVLFQFSANSSPNLNLARLRVGVPVTILVNFGSFTGSFFPTCTNPAGTAQTTQLIVQGVSGEQLGVSSTSSLWIGNGASYAGNLFMAFQHN